MNSGTSSRNPGGWTPVAPPVLAVPLPSSPIQSAGFSHRESFASPIGSTRAGQPPLHPILNFDPTGRLLLDFVQPFTSIRFRPFFPSNVMDELATAFPSSCLYINLPGFPRWSIEVPNSTGVTVRDVLTKLYESFHCRVGKDEFVNFPQPLQSAASVAFNIRTSKNPAERAHGIKRMDFLFPNLFFVGLSPTADGHRWDINLSPAVL